jgi:hypothetical protein
MQIFISSLSFPPSFSYWHHHVAEVTDTPFAFSFSHLPPPLAVRYSPLGVFDEITKSTLNANITDKHFGARSLANSLGTALYRFARGQCSSLTATHIVS